MVDLDAGPAGQPDRGGSTPRVATLGEVVAAMDALYDPRLAAAWDAVGLVCGDPTAPVRKVAFAVDPVQPVVEEALGWGADLLVTHHPLFLTGVHGVAATTAKGRVVHSLVRAGAALLVAHTNADSADPGVSDALADLLGMGEREPLAPEPADPLDKVVTFVPHADAAAVLDALAGAGAGSIGAYDRCAFSGEGTGTFRPGPGSKPSVGTVGEIERVLETRLEMVLPRHRRAAVVAALRRAHPYEEPAFDVVELAPWPSARGTGRVGDLAEATTLGELVVRVAAALPATAGGLRVAGDPDRTVRRVAVCGGSGDSLLEAARRAGADAYLTADLRHHRASEALSDGGPALVDAAHWATEWPWLPVAARLLSARLSERGTTVETFVSGLVTDPWSFRA